MIHRCTRTLLLMPVIALVMLAPASAQFGGGSSSPTGVDKGPKPTAPKQAPPPAVPGSRGEPTEAAPAERPPGDLPPTEALFDAINRGDLASAKDAVARGADLSARNVLGSTPLEQSVDLGRNEISFLLLSLRGTVDQGSQRSTERPPDLPTPTAAQRRAQAAADRRLTRATAVSPGDATPQVARLFANDGGTPVPQAGFLGFDAGRR